MTAIHLVIHKIYFFISFGVYVSSFLSPLLVENIAVKDASSLAATTTKTLMIQQKGSLKVI